MLTDQVLARRLARQARVVVRREHTWASVADRTAAVYARAEPEERALRARTAPSLVIRAGNLLTGTDPLPIPD